MAIDPKDGKPVLMFEDQDGWMAWLRENHAGSRGVWLRLAKKASGVPSVSYADAIETALCYGWIDGQRRPGDEHCWLQKFTPRLARSIWSKINRDKALALIAGRKMQAAGLEEVERAKADGRWDAAYDSVRGSTVPADLQAALDANPKAKAFFAMLDNQNRYAVLFRIQTAKRAETRARRIAQFTAMLERKEKLHP